MHFGSEFCVCSLLMRFYCQYLYFMLIIDRYLNIWVYFADFDQYACYRMQLHVWNQSKITFINSDLVCCEKMFFLFLIHWRVSFRCNHYVIYHNLCYNCGWNAPCFGCNSSNRLENYNRGVFCLKPPKYLVLLVISA